MEIILISESKLKIALCEDDLKSFEISAEELDYSTTETKRMFWELLNQAKHKTGFDTDGQRVLVQLYPSKDGGCEMFVTKIGLLDESDNKTTRSEGYDKLSSQIKKSKKPSVHKNTSSAYSFDSIDTLVRVCRRLSDIGYVSNSTAYKGDNGKFYLLLCDIESASYTPLDEFSFISEYGTKENSDMAKHYISEHASPICKKHAVSTLGKL